MPSYVALAGEVLVVLGWIVIFFVFRENTFTSSTIELAPDQKVISTGPYAWVRHPMYGGGFLMLLGMPLALGSWWGVVVFVAIIPALIWRLLDEEKFLARNLPGYVEYQRRVRCCACSRWCGKSCPTFDRGPSERSGAEIQRLHHVVGRFGQRHRVVDREGAERRSPGQAHADRRTHDVVVRQLQRLRGAGEGGRSAIMKHAAGIDKGRGLQAVFIGNAGDRAL